MCGLAWVLPSRILTGAAYLRLLLVAEGRQRAGTGAALLAAAEGAARRSRITWCSSSPPATPEPVASTRGTATTMSAACQA